LSHSCRPDTGHVGPRRLRCGQGARTGAPGSSSHTILPHVTPAVLYLASCGVRPRIAWPETHDNLTNMESWRQRMSSNCRGAVRRQRLHDTASGELVLAAAGPVANAVRLRHLPRTTRRHMGHAATYTRLGPCWSGPGSTRPRKPRYLRKPRKTQGTPEPPPCPGPVPPSSTVQNVTDVDDPLLERADTETARTGVSWPGGKRSGTARTWRRCASCPRPT